MFRRLELTLIALLFMNFLSGCIIHKTERIAPNDSLLTKETIEQVILKTGETISFDDNGSFCVYNEKVIAGTENGIFKAVPYNEIMIFRSMIPEPVTFEQAKSEKVKEIIIGGDGLGDRLIRFVTPGAEIITDKEIIRGVNEFGIERSYKLKYVKQIFLKADTVDRRDIVNGKVNNISQVILNKGKGILNFDEPGAVLKTNFLTINGRDKSGKNVYINPDDILYLNVKRVNVEATTVATVGVAALAVAVIYSAASAGNSNPSPSSTSHSCPFIYSFNGSNYVFDAEPLGGAITKGLEREEYSRLEELKAVDNKYKLLIKNEADETQHLDKISLLVFDHPVGSEIIENGKGEFRQVYKTEKPLSAKDENGCNLMKFFAKDDNIAWQTLMPVDPGITAKQTRHSLELKFHKQKGATHANLIVKGGTSYWGSQIMYEMTALRGGQLNEWYSSIDQKKSDYSMLTNFLENEELFTLKVYLKEKDKWVRRGAIFGGGPLMVEKRIVPLDISNVDSDEITVRLNPPMGFWSFDQFEIEYNSTPAKGAAAINISSDQADKKENITTSLNKVDQLYYTMPRTGDTFKAEFDVPVQKPGTKRTVFLHSSGWYEMHLDKTLKPQAAQLYKLAFEQGAIVRFAMEKYSEMKDNIMKQ